MSPDQSERSESPTGWSRRPVNRLMLLLAALLWVAPLASIPLIDPDEGRYGEIPREMLATGDLLTPRLNGTLYFEKPPLHYWLTAGALRLLGETELAVRLWTSLFGLGTAAVLLALGGLLAGARTARLAAALLLASPFFFSLAHLATLDMTLTFFVTVALAGFWKAQGAADAVGRGLGWGALFGGAALAVMSKGLVGLVLPGGVIFCYLLLSGRWRLLREVPWLSGTALFLVLAAPWHVLVARENPSFVHFYFVREHFLRYATPVAERGEPFWFLFAVLAVGLLPWIGLLALAPRLRGGSGAGFDVWRRERPELLFLLCWIGFPLLFFSLSQSKLAPYVLPVAPPLALLVAMALHSREREGGEWRARERLGLAVGAAGSLAVGLAATALASGLLPSAVPPLGDAHTFRPLPFAAGLAAAGVGVALLVRASRRHPGALGGAVLSATALLTAALWALAAVEAPARSGRAIAEVLAPRLEPGDRVVCVAGFRQSLAFYLGRLIGSAAPHQDLAFGVSQLPEEARRERFPAGDELKAWWDSERRLYVVVDHKHDRLRAKGLTGGTVLFSNKRLQLVVNHRPAER